MLPELISLGPINISTFGIFVALAFVIFSFLLWKSLREDYPEEEILTFTILLTLFALLGARIFYVVNHFADFNLSFDKWILFTRFPGFSLVGGFWGGLIFSFLWGQKKKWDFWILSDNGIFASLAALVMGSFGVLLITPNTLAILPKALWPILVFLTATFLLRQYRKFLWYKSGKPGFVACATLILYFWGSFALDFWQGVGLYLEQVEALAVVVMALIFLYRRSGRVIREDLASFAQLRKK